MIRHKSLEHLHLHYPLIIKFISAWISQFYYKCMTSEKIFRNICYDLGQYRKISIEFWISIQDPFKIHRLKKSHHYTNQKHLMALWFLFDINSKRIIRFWIPKKSKKMPKNLVYISDLLSAQRIILLSKCFFCLLSQCHDHPLLLDSYIICIVGGICTWGGFYFINVHVLIE